MKKERISIQAQVIISFTTLAIILVLLVLFVFVGLSDLKTRTHHLAAHEVPKLRLISSLNQNVGLTHVSLHRHVRSSITSEMEEHERIINTNIKNDDQNFQEYEKLIQSSEEWKLYMNVISARRRYNELLRQYLELSREHRDEEAYVFGVTKQRPAYDRYRESMKDLADFVDAKAHEMGERASNSIIETTTKINIIAGVGLLVAFGMCFILFNVTKRMREQNQVLKNEIQERRIAEEKLLRLNRLYTVISNINQAIVWYPDLEKLFEEVCRIIVEYGQMKMVWIGILENNEKTIRVVSSHGVNDGYLEAFSPSIDLKSTRYGPIARKIHKGYHFVSNDIENDHRDLPWRPAALEKGFHSTAAFSFIVSGRVSGMLQIFSGKKGSFDKQELCLLTRVSADISHAIESIEHDRQRLHAEEKIKELNEKLEKRVVERTAELVAANKELESFAYSVSHDLRAPLRHISGFLDLFNERVSGNLDSESTRYLNIIMESSQRMGSLIDDLLSFSKMGRQEMQRTHVDISRIIEEVIRDLKYEIENRNVIWKIDPLPAIIGDDTMIRQVIINLIENALKFSRNREVTRIEVGYVDSAIDEHIFYIRDNGVGFDMRYGDKLFSVFQRLHPVNEFEGTGIGLANVRRIINRHGGRTWAESVPGESATFYFSIPKYTYIPSKQT